MAAAPPVRKPRILCVDDEPGVLEGLSLTLGRRYEVLAALGGPQGLEILQKERDVEVVMSDMRMPGMDGAAFLSKARQLAPDVVRMLLTGQAELGSAIAAVNEGQIFRFLTKPCSPSALTTAMVAAVEQHRLITSERVLLEQTLQGAVKTLTDILALTHPTCFGRATRQKRHVTDVAARLNLQPRWQVEVAAMLSQLGYITLPPELTEKVYQGHGLLEAEQQMLEKATVVTEQLLSHIPRLEGVRYILANYSNTPKTRPADEKERHLDLSAAILRVVTDFDALESRGTLPAIAIDIMRGRAGQYLPEVLDALGEVISERGGVYELRELPISKLRAGMICAEEVRLTTGGLLVPRGYEITESFVVRARNFSAGYVREPMKMMVRPD